MSRGLVHDTLVLSTAEYLAKQDGYSEASIEPYLAQSRQLHTDEGVTVLPKEVAEAVELHALMAHDDELSVLARRPKLREKYFNADANQVKATNGPRNLDYFLHHGVEYQFDQSQAARILQIATAGDKPLTEALMRENVVSASGYENVRLNYIYHDVLDHVWLMDFMRQRGLADRYADYLESVGNPFEGNLMSREAELLSGIGFTSRRYLSDTDRYGKLAPAARVITDSLSPYAADARVANAIDIVDSRPDIAQWAGFVIIDTIANVILQRAKRGTVKKLAKMPTGGYVSTGQTAELFDPRYIAMIIETVDQLSTRKEEYIEAQIKLNFLIENALRRFTQNGEAAGALSLSQAINLEGIPDPHVRTLGNIGLSTTYFKG